jgi:hypothetical protein
MDSFAPVPPPSAAAVESAEDLYNKLKTTSPARNLIPSTTPGSRHCLATAIGIHQTRILEPPGLSLLPLLRLGQRSYHL